MKNLRIGDLVQVIRYGHLIWINDPIQQKELTKAREPFAVKGNTILYDMLPEIVGKQGIVRTVSTTQGITAYALEGIPSKTAWYHRDQLLLIKENTVYET